MSQVDENGSFAASAVPVSPSMAAPPKMLARVEDLQAQHTKHNIKEAAKMTPQKTQQSSIYHNLTYSLQFIINISDLLNL
jgi:hypothetical protein